MFFCDDFKADYYRMTGMVFRMGVGTVVNLALRHNVRYMFWVRRHLKTKGLFSRFMMYRYSRKYGLEFSPNISLGKGLYLGHPYNITIGDGTVLGCNVNIYKGATIGVENRGRREGAPTIGNCVYIGINAVLVGRLTIGDDVLIGPGAYVNFDVPSHSVVLGNPGIIHHRENATKQYIYDCF